MNKTDLKQHIGYWINRVRMEVHQAFEQRLAKYDITVAQWCILVTLYDNRAATVGELSEYIDVDKASISRVVEKLVSIKLAVHKQGKDRRSGFITLTQKGLQLIPKLIQGAEDNENHFFGHLTLEEKDQLRKAVKKILTTVPSIRQDGWLHTKDIVMIDPKQHILTILKTAKEELRPYPQTFEALKNAGVAEYTVSFGETYTAVYRGNFGEVQEPVLEGFKPVLVAHSFSPDDVKQAIKDSQQKKINFVAFLSRIGAAGVSHYHVDMNTRIITYYAPSKAHSYTEKIPHILT